MFKKILLVLSLLCLSITSYGFNRPDSYIGFDAGIFTATFNQVYRDQTDVIPANIAETVQQNGYGVGLNLGMRYLYRDRYWLGGEAAARFNFRSAQYFAGATGTVFTDKTKVKNYLDLVFVPGFILIPGTEIYGKIGISFAYITDYLSSPVGFLAVTTNYQSNTYTPGFAAGLGLRKYFKDKLSVYIETNYHDYGTINFANFLNFSASYTHSVHVNTYDTVAGISYHF